MLRAKIAHLFKEKKMKLTPKIKREIDNFSKAKLMSLYRFFPSDITTGQTGKYIAKVVRRDRVKEFHHEPDELSTGYSTPGNTPVGSV